MTGRRNLQLLSEVVLVRIWDSLSASEMVNCSRWWGARPWRYAAIGVSETSGWLTAALRLILIAAT